MKKLRPFSLMILVVCATLTLSSCDWLAGLFEPFIGTWELTAETVDGTPLNIPASASMTMVVNSDNTLTASGDAMGSAVSVTGTWARSGSSYILGLNTVIAGMGTQSATITGSLSSDKKSFTGSGTATWTSGAAGTSVVNLLEMRKQ